MRDFMADLKRIGSGWSDTSHGRSDVETLYRIYYIYIEGGSTPGKRDGIRRMGAICASCRPGMSRSACTGC